MTAQPWEHCVVLGCEGWQPHGGLAADGRGAAVLPSAPGQRPCQAAAPAPPAWLPQRLQRDKPGQAHASGSARVTGGTVKAKGVSAETSSALR